MKHITSFLALAVSLTVYACTPSGYTIDGTFSFPEGKTGETLILGTVLGQATVNLDTLTVTEGRYHFEGTAETPSIAFIQSESYTVLFILENGSIRIDGSVASGTESNDIIGAAVSEMVNDPDEKAFGTMYGQYAADPSSVDYGELTAAYEKATAHAAATLENALKESTTSIASVYLFNELTRYLSEADDLVRCVEYLPEEARKHPAIAPMVQAIESMKGTAEGSRFTDFTVENGAPDGSAVKFSDYVGCGKYVLVDFWASWCGPCKREIPNLKNVQTTYAGDDFTVLSVAVWDSREDTEKAIREEGLFWPQILDAQRIPTDIYGIQGIPHIMLIGPDGTILARNLRGSAIEEEVSKYVKAKK